MALVITEPCIGCGDQACVAACPMDCIHPGMVAHQGNSYDQLFIDPQACIDCGLCEPECPVDAIFAEDEVPVEWNHFITVKAEFYRQPKE